MKRRLLYFGAVAAIYTIIYILCRQFFNHLYTPDWTAKNILVPAALISSIPALFGWFRLPYITLIGYITGVISGELFGGFQRNVPPRFLHYGWLICICIYFISVVLGIVVEFKKRSTK